MLFFLFHEFWHPSSWMFLYSSKESDKMRIWFDMRIPPDTRSPVSRGVATQTKPDNVCRCPLSSITTNTSCNLPLRCIKMQLGTLMFSCHSLYQTVDVIITAARCQWKPSLIYCTTCQNVGETSEYASSIILWLIAASYHSTSVLSAGLKLGFVLSG